MNLLFKSLLPIFCAAALLIGCKTSPTTTKALVKSTVQIGVSVGVSQEPGAIPYLRYAAPVVCEAAKGTNIQPAAIVSALQSNAQANAVKNPQAVLIFNSAFGVYEALFDAYGADEVASRAQLQAWLEGTCEGILAGLPPAAGLFGAAPVKLPPHIK
jgi:hypothetical protein